MRLVLVFHFWWKKYKLSQFCKYILRVEFTILLVNSICESQSFKSLGKRAITNINSLLILLAMA